jgi:hypothetical protein
MRDDPFADLDRLRLSPETVAAMDAAAKQESAPSRKRHARQFVMVPWLWVERLQEARYMATYRVALYVLFQYWKTQQPVPVSNVALKARGVPRRSKYRAIRELERLGLVRVEQRARRSPVITVCAKS